MYTLAIFNQQRAALSFAMAIRFACFSPHPPLLLPHVGTPKDREKVKKTTAALNALAERFKKAKVDILFIASPHPDWGFNVPLYFLAPCYSNGNTCPFQIKEKLIGQEPPSFYFKKGQQFFSETDKNRSYGLIGSGDLSHYLKEDGPYGFHPHGPKFDQALIECLKNKEIDRFLNLDKEFPGAGECGLRSFSFILGILEGAGVDWQAEALSYEAPFGVGYLVVNFKL